MFLHRCLFAAEGVKSPNLKKTAGGRWTPKGGVRLLQGANSVAQCVFLAECTQQNAKADWV